MEIRCSFINERAGRHIRRNLRSSSGRLNHTPIILCRSARSQESVLSRSSSGSEWENGWKCQECTYITRVHVSPSSRASTCHLCLVALCRLTASVATWQECTFLNKDLDFLTCAACGSERVMGFDPEISVATQLQVVIQPRYIAEIHSRDT